MQPHETLAFVGAGSAVLQVIVTVAIIWYWQKEHDKRLQMIVTMLTERSTIFQEIKDRQDFIRQDISSMVHDLIGNKLRSLDKIEDIMREMREVRDTWEKRWERMEDLIFQSWLEPNLKK